MDTDFGTYGEENKRWTADEAKGFIKIYANQSIIVSTIHTNDTSRNNWRSWVYSR